MQLEHTTRLNATNSSVCVFVCEHRHTIIKLYEQMLFFFSNFSGSPNEVMQQREGKKRNHFEISNDSELTRFCLWLHRIRSSCSPSFIFILQFLFHSECHFNRLLCLSNDRMFSSAIVFINEMHGCFCNDSVTNFICNCRLNLILSLLTHINAYPCTICNAQKDNLFLLWREQWIHKQCPWFTDDFLLYDTERKKQYMA